MPRKGFSGEQFAFALRQAWRETLVGEECRKLGVREQSFVGGRSNLPGMGSGISAD